MPKTQDTRKQKAAELLKLVTNGPSLSPNFDDTPFTPEQAAYHYRLWASTWVIPLVKELVPELREKKS